MILYMKSIIPCLLLVGLMSCSNTKGPTVADYRDEAVVVCSALCTFYPKEGVRRESLHAISNSKEKAWDSIKEDCLKLQSKNSKAEDIGEKLLISYTIVKGELKDYMMAQANLENACFKYKLAEDLPLGTLIKQ